MMDFSEQKFLNKILANTTNVDNGAMATLEKLGFPNHVAQLALAACGGDVQKATQMCLSGYNFNPDFSNKPKAKFSCSICGQGHLSKVSFDTHVKSCTSVWTKRHPKLPIIEVPHPFAHLQEYYDSKSQGAEAHAANIRAKTDQRTPGQFGDLGQENTPLEECEFCHRKFRADRIPTHQKACAERKRQEAAKQRPKSRGSTGDTKSYSSTSSQQNNKRYSEFSNALLECETCGRKFQKSSFDAHAKRCAEQTGKTATASGKRTSSKKFPVEPTYDDVPANNTVLEEMVQKKVIEQVSEDEAPIAASIAFQNLVDLELYNRQDLVIYKVCEDRTRMDRLVYNAMVTCLTERDGKEPKEEVLYHGTTWDSVASITQGGFNRAYSRKRSNQAKLGVATYFSPNADFSLRYCARNHPWGKMLIVAKVLVGQSTKGDKDHVEAPLRPDGEHFDSTVDSEENTNIVAVFKDFQALPMFLIECRVKTETAPRKLKLLRRCDGPAIEEEED